MNAFFDVLFLTGLGGLGLWALGLLWTLVLGWIPSPGPIVMGWLALSLTCLFVGMFGLTVTDKASDRAFDRQIERTLSKYR